MRIIELLQESLSRIVYHYTSVPTAIKIINSGQFELSLAIGSIEQQFMPKGKPYFLSTTRTRRGGYHSNKNDSNGVLFELDGNWFNQNYKSKSIDYWNDRSPKNYLGRSHEAEDRVFSSEPTIPIKGVKAIHILYTPDYKDTSEWGQSFEARIQSQIRKLIILSKKVNIPVYFYTDKNAWFNMNKQQLGDVGILSGKSPITNSRIRRRKSFLSSWIELMKLDRKENLSKDADRLRYNISYSYDRAEAINILNNDMSNARKPDAGKERDHAIQIIAYMKQNKLTVIKDFVEHLANKWKNIVDTAVK